MMYQHQMDEMMGKASKGGGLMEKREMGILSQPEQTHPQRMDWPHWPSRKHSICTDGGLFNNRVK